MTRAEVSRSTSLQLKTSSNAEERIMRQEIKNAVKDNNYDIEIGWRMVYLISSKTKSC